MTSAATHNEAEDRSAAHKAIIASAIGLGLSGSIELAIALVTHSVGLLGDSLHNLSDVSTSGLVFIGFLVSKRTPNQRYPYGYERAEDIAGLGVALVIWASAVFAGVESYHKFVAHSPTTHLPLGMFGAFLGIVANQTVARYKGHVGRQIHSTTLLADARHSWLDAISSLGALIGLVLVELGYPIGDPIAGLVITLFIAHVGYEVTSEMLHHLMDGVDAAMLQTVVDTVKVIPEVFGVRARGRWMGRSLCLEVEVEFGPDLSLKQVSEHSKVIEDAILASVSEARQVLIIPRKAQSQPEASP